MQQCPTVFLSLFGCQCEVHWSMINVSTNTPDWVEIGLGMHVGICSELFQNHTTCMKLLLNTVLMNS